VLVVLLASTVRADDGPPWLRAVLDRPVTQEAPRTGSVVLEIERRVSMTVPGRVVHREHGAIRVLTRDGADAAAVSVPYRTDGGKVRDLKGWLVTPNGAVTRLTSRDESDRALIGEDLYNEVRVRSLDAGKVPEGTVFAYDWTVEQPEPFANLEWSFQEEAPVELARFVLETPPDWRVTSELVNHDPLEPRRDGGTLVWELRGLNEIEDEPYCPTLDALVPRIELTAHAPAGTTNAPPAFANWAEVARWLDALAVSAGPPDDAVRARARSLVATARTEIDTLRALARFVQGIRYASIQMGIARGGGYTPRPPPQVLARAYGDCKDKANLLRALLESVGRPAHLVALYLGDPTYVRADWPSPSPFNHCIIAIPMRGKPRLAAEVQDPSNGRVLIFDPTDPYTPIGDLSTHSQGGLALIVSRSTTDLTRLPELPPDAATLFHRIDLEVDATGGVSGTLTERTIGQAAVSERALLRGYDRVDYRKAIVAWVRQAMNGAELTRVEIVDDSTMARFETTVVFRVPGYGQLLQDRLLVLKPPHFTRLGVALTADRPRRYPVLMAARAVQESLTVRMPEGFEIDELPDPTALDGPLATYTCRTTAEAPGVRQSRTLTTRRGQVPPGDFASLRNFYARVRSSEEAPIVFARR